MQVFSSFLFSFNLPLFRNFLSIIFYFTLTNIFPGSQEIHFPYVCFDKWNENCALQSASKISDEKAAGSTEAPCHASLFLACVHL